MAQRAWVSMHCGRDRRAPVATFQRAGGEWQIVAVGRGDGGRPVSGRIESLGAIDLG